MKVEVADIATVDADVVVVSADTSLEFEGGAARALEAVCGPALAIELATAAALKPVRVADVIVTTAGRHKRLRQVLWAVVRNYADRNHDDDAAVESALRRVWREVARLSTTDRLRVAIVPLGAVELGVARSAALIARTLRAARLSTTRVAVTIVTNRPGDVDSIRRAVDAGAPATPAASATDWQDETIVDEEPAGASASKAQRPAPSSPARPPPTPGALSKRAVIGEAVVETFDRCGGVAPVGCTGVMFRVRRTGTASRFTVKVSARGTVEDLAVDSVPVSDRVALHDGAHVLTCQVHPSEGQFYFHAQLQGLVSFNSTTDVKVLLVVPSAGWRQQDFVDDEWLKLVNKPGQGLVLPDGAVPTGPLWVRWRFTHRRAVR